MFKKSLLYASVQPRLPWSRGTRVVWLGTEQNGGKQGCANIQRARRCLFRRFGPPEPFFCACSSQIAKIILTEVSIRVNCTKGGFRLRSHHPLVVQGSLCASSPLHSWASSPLHKHLTDFMHSLVQKKLKLKWRTRRNVTISLDQSQ